MKKITVIALLLAAALGAQARNGSGKPAYKDASRPVEERVSDLLSRMTLEEKVMQLNQYTLGRNDNANNVADPVDKIPAEIGSLIYFDTSPGLRNRLQKKAIEQSRLGIPVLFGYDVIHGFRTTYPISLAQACSWNPALVKQAAEVAAQEARMSGVEWTFSPMIDVARDGRWGRVSEATAKIPTPTPSTEWRRSKATRATTSPTPAAWPPASSISSATAPRRPAATTSTPKSRVRRSGTPTCRPTRRASRPEPLR